MGKRKGFLALLLAAALALSGCGGQKEEAAPTAGPEAEQAAATQAQGPLADSVRALLEPYRETLSQAADNNVDSLAYTIPGDNLNRMALDAAAESAEAREGRWRFTRHETGDYTYEATAWEAMDAFAQEGGATPNPADETPLDSQLNGDYAVSGGGLFDRERVYDVAEDLTEGRLTFTDTLNGQTTGHEVFRFCVRGGELIFADATLDTAVQTDGAAAKAAYLAAVGMLRADGLEVVEYPLTGPDDLPDPASLDFSRLLLSVTPVSHVTIQTKQSSK